MPFLEWLQATHLSAAIGESTWAVPIIGTIHVLGIAWFAGGVLIRDPQLRNWKRIGLAIILLSGALLFCAQPVRLYASVSFRIKLALLVLIAIAPRGKGTVGLSLVLWAATIFAARGIAFF
jgi:hypothetical protein